MAHLAGIDKGLMEHYRKWRKKVEVLFKGPLNTANDAVKCNYIIYWSSEIGMELVDKQKLKERSTMETGTLSKSILICLRNI